MPSYRTDPSSADRTGAILAVVAVHAGIAALVLANPGRLAAPARPTDTVLIDIAQPPPPPPPAQQPSPKPKEAEGAAGKKAEPSPVVAPEPKLKSPNPLPAAPVAGTGNAPSAGAAIAGTGTGAGGSGSGTGGGGGGSPAQWLSGGLANSDYPREALGARLGGTVSVRFTVLASGRIADCRAVRSSGSALLDDTTCRLLTQRLRFRPATDGNGRPVASVIGSDYTWGVRDRRR